MVTRDPRKKTAEILDLGNPQKLHPLKICTYTELFLAKKITHYSQSYAGILNSDVTDGLYKGLYL